MCFLLMTFLQSTTLHFTLQEMSLQIAMQQVVHSARGKASTALLRCATGDTEDSFACRGCCIESLYKTDGNLHVQYIPISSHSHSIIPIPIPMKRAFTFPWDFPDSCSPRMMGPTWDVTVQ